MKRKRILCAILCFLLIGVMSTGCGNAAGKSKGKYSVVCTIFPEYDWVREVLGDKADNFDLTLLMDNGVDLHSYQPTARDIMNISDCDVFIYVGGESDKWVADILKEASNKDMIVINLLDTLGSQKKEEELVEGMEGEEEEAGDEEAGEVEYDEHVWLSLKNAVIFTTAIKDAICKVDADNKEIYENNATAYIQKLTELDAQYEEIVNNSTTKTVLFGDRFPFRYLADDYGLEYYAAFSGCSAETEASFDTVTFLAGKVDELGLSKVFVIENSDKKLARTIVENTKDKNQDILELNSLQTASSSDAQKGITYLELMKNNLEVLQKGLK